MRNVILKSVLDVVSGKRTLNKSGKIGKKTDKKAPFLISLRLEALENRELLSVNPIGSDAEAFNLNPDILATQTSFESQTSLKSQHLEATAASL